MPDKVSFINATMVDFMTPPPTTKTEHEIHGDILWPIYVLDLILILKFMEKIFFNNFENLILSMFEIHSLN